MRDADAFVRERDVVRAPRAPDLRGCRNPSAAICAQVLDSSSVRELVASLAPGTCRNRLWLLPSGPDQVHQTAMRGGPPPPIVRQRNEPIRKRSVSFQSALGTYSGA